METIYFWAEFVLGTLIVNYLSSCFMKISKSRISVYYQINDSYFVPGSYIDNNQLPCQHTALQAAIHSCGLQMKFSSCSAIIRVKTLIWGHLSLEKVNIVCINKRN